MPGRRPRGPVILIGLLLFLVAIEGGFLALLWFRDPGRASAGSPVLRGRRVAGELGCFACHGPEGAEGIPNHGASIAVVPDWIGGTYTMFNESPEEIRGWILDGAPGRLLADHSYIARRDRQLIRMPAYRGRVSESDLGDLVAYVQAVSGAYNPPGDSPAAEGRRLTVEHGCLGCHGPEGRGLLGNPGSLKGYIPSWDSEDYADLVRSPEEFREWVSMGEIRRLRDNPAAAVFLDRQMVKMPSFREVLDDAEIESLRAYVEWVRARPRPAP